MKINISSSEAVRAFGECLARIKYRGDTFVITKNKEPVAQLIPTPGAMRGTWQELSTTLQSTSADASFGDDLERVNASDRPYSNSWA